MRALVLSAVFVLAFGSDDAVQRRGAVALPSATQALPQLQQRDEDDVDALDLSDTNRTREALLSGSSADDGDFVPGTQNNDSLGSTRRSLPEHEVDSRAGRGSGETLPLLPRDLQTFRAAVGDIGDENCRREARQLLHGLQNLSSWAVQMYDASAKLPLGVLAGSTFNFGNFDECLDVSVLLDAGRLRGQYCLARVVLSESSRPHPRNDPRSSLWTMLKGMEGRKAIRKDELHLAFCVPAACTARDLQAFLTSTLVPAHVVPGIDIAVVVEDAMCQIREPVQLDNLDIAFISVMAFFLMLLIVASLYDYFTIETHKKENNSGLMRDALMAFSVPANIQKLCRFKPSPDALECLFGVRLISMVFVLIGHAVLFIVGGPVLNADFLNQELLRVENGVLFNNQLFVDTFFIVSGFLMCYLLLKELDRRKTINILVIYVLRYIRLTPAYIAVVAFYVTIFSKVDSGPLWQMRVGVERERCMASWWTNILYVNNYINTDRLCMFQSWFISADTQLFMLAPLFIYPLWRRPVLGQSILVLAIAVSIAIPFALTWVQHLDPLLMFYRSEIEDISLNQTFLNAYIKTHMRATPYLCGILLGYTLYNYHSSGKKFPKVLLRCGWVLCPLSAVCSMFSSAIFYAPGHQYNPLEAAVYAALDKVGWCIGIAWILFGCITGNGGFLQKLLTWRPLVPFARLTYCAYLANGIIELHSIGTLREPLYLSIFDMVKTSVAHILLTFLLALLLCLLFESPTHALQSCLLRKERKIKEDGDKSDS